MGTHRTNRKVVTGNRKDQQRELKRTWQILDPLTKKGRAYLPAEDMYRRHIADMRYF